MEAITKDEPADYSYTGTSDTYEEDVRPYEGEGELEDHSDESDAEGDETAEDEKEKPDSGEEPSVGDRATD